MREDWIEVELGDVCDLKNGFAFKSKDYVEISETMNFRMSQIRPNGKIDLDHNPKYLPDEYAFSYSDYLLENGDIVIAMTDMASDTKILGVPTIVKQDKRKLLLNQRVGKLFNLNTNCVYIPYLRYIITSPQIYSYYKKLGKGGVQINLSKDDILNAKLPLAPLPEQRAIAAKIEQLFSELDNGIANLKAAKSKLEIYRQAILKQAFEGNWEWIVLSDIADITGGVTKGRKLDGKQTFEYPYLRVANVQDGYLDLSTIKTIEVLSSDFDKYELKHEDILFTEGGDRDKLGRGTVWKNEIKNCIHQNHIFRARIQKKDGVSPYFITYYAQSPQGKDYFFKKGKHTTNLASINKTILSNLPIPLPPIKEQKQIVQEIETRLSVCDKLNESIDQSLEKAQALRQSILKKAFEGKLLSQDELQTCRQQPDWEPAAKLLERVKKDSKTKR